MINLLKPPFSPLNVPLSNSNFISLNGLNPSCKLLQFMGFSCFVGGERGSHKVLTSWHVLLWEQIKLQLSKRLTLIWAQTLKVLPNFKLLKFASKFVKLFAQFLSTIIGGSFFLELQMQIVHAYGPEKTDKTKNLNASIIIKVTLVIHFELIYSGDTKSTPC